MRGFRNVVLAFAMVGLATAPLQAQSSGVERVFDRMGNAVERLMSRLGSAFEGENEGGYNVAWADMADDFEWSGSIRSGGTLEIKGINGPIVAEVASGSEVRVTAQARGNRSDPESVRIEVVEHDGGLTFCAVYPTPSGKRDNYCGPGESGRMSTEKNDVEVRFVVYVPEGVAFIGRTVNGDVEAIDLESDVELITVNGGIDVSTTGFARASTVNGSIDARMGAFDRRSGAEFSTINGSIELDVPDDIDADLDASWMNGGLESDLPMVLEGRVRRTRAQAKLGDGGPELRVSTINGSIRIR